MTSNWSLHLDKVSPNKKVLEQEMLEQHLICKACNNYVSKKLQKCITCRNSLASFQKHRPEELVLKGKKIGKTKSSKNWQEEPHVEEKYCHIPKQSFLWDWCHYAWSSFCDSKFKLITCACSVSHWKGCSDNYKYNMVGEIATGWWLSVMHSFRSC